MGTFVYSIGGDVDIVLLCFWCFCSVVLVVQLFCGYGGAIVLWCYCSEVLVLQLFCGDGGAITLGATITMVVISGAGATAEMVVSYIATDPFPL